VFHQPLRFAGLVLALVPATLYVGMGVAALGRGAGWIGFSYVLIVAPLIVLAFLAWKWPRQGGSALIVMGAALAFLFLLDARGRYPLSEVTYIEAAIFAPAILAGFLFRAAVRMEKPRDQRELR